MIELIAKMENLQKTLGYAEAMVDVGTDSSSLDDRDRRLMSCTQEILTEAYSKVDQIITHINKLNQESRSSPDANS